jgi:protein SCO1/2
MRGLKTRATKVKKLLVIICLILISPLARADRMEAAPDALQGIGIDEKGGATLPLNTVFKDEKGQVVSLNDYFHHDRPVILQLSYFGCPMLCGLVSNGMVDSLNDLKLTMGKDYDVINVSFDPSETPALANLKKQSFLSAYNRPAGAASWHFLTGTQQSIDTLTQAVGFQYKWIEAKHQFSHPAALILLSPEGKITRYLYGVKYDPRTLRLSLVEASNGKVGTTLDRVILTCFHYDAYAGKYNVVAMNVMRLGGVTTVLILSCVISGWLIKERRTRARASEAPAEPHLSNGPGGAGAPPPQYR